MEEKTRLVKGKDMREGDIYWSEGWITCDKRHEEIYNDTFPHRKFLVKNINPDEWISVNDSLPKANERVILFDSKYPDCMCCGSLDEQGNWWAHNESYLTDDRPDTVTHWRPMPEAPKL